MRRPPSSESRVAGFGLTETMIAVGVIATALLVLVQQLSLGFRESEANEDRTFCHQKAAAMLGEIRNAIDLGRITSGDELAALADIEPNLVLTTRKDHEGLPFAADHPMSGNVQRGDVWRFARTVEVEPEGNAGLFRCRVAMLQRRDDGWRHAASNAMLFSLLPKAEAPVQVHDVYVLACAEAPSLWGNMAQLRDHVQSSAMEIAARSQARLRLHWITRLGYGRDPCYAPYVNVHQPADAAAPFAYWLPGRLGSQDGHADLYVGDLLAGTHRTEDGFVHGLAGALASPSPIADRFNHCLRSPAAWSLFEERVAQGLENEDEPPLQLLLDDLQRRPDRYRHAIFVNLHGAGLPLPPLRNFSDAAKDPVGRPGVRVVTHPARLWTPRDRNGDGQHDDTDDLELRVYAYRTQAGDDTLAEPIVVEIHGGDFTSAVNAEDPTLLVHRLQGGIDLATGKQSGDPGPYAPFDATTGLAPSKGEQPFSMRCETGFVGGKDPYTFVRLYNTPLCAPQAQGGGLPPAGRLYGLEYNPSPVDGAFGRDLATADDGLAVRNTARWRIRIPKSAFGRGLLPNRDQTLRIVTRIGTNADVGARWPDPRQPHNRSETFAWWSRSESSVPPTERAQFLGDPRHSPYADHMAGAGLLSKGYNACFAGFAGPEYDLSRDWPGLDGSRLQDGVGHGVAADAPRLLELLRTGLQCSGAVFTLAAGAPVEALLLGGEIASPGDGERSVTLHADYAGPGTTRIDTVSPGTDRGERALAAADGGAWAHMPWLGELFPEGRAAEWIERGNLALGAGPEPLCWTPVASLAAPNLPPGAGPGIARSQTLGPCGAALLAANGASTSALGAVAAARHDLVPQGAQAIAESVSLEAPSDLQTAWTLRTDASTGMPSPALDGPDALPRSVLQPLETAWTLAAAENGAVWRWSSDTAGAAALALWAAPQDALRARTVAAHALLLSLRALHLAGAPGLPLPMRQLPRCCIVEPQSGAAVAASGLVTLRWQTEWARYDGAPYAATYPEPFEPGEQDLVYRVLWSRDQGETWTCALTGEPTVAGTFPEDPEERLSDAGQGMESFTFALPPELPPSEILLAVEAWRSGLRLGHAEHRTLLIAGGAR